jgi:hypothetical protein
MGRDRLAAARPLPARAARGTLSHLGHLNTNPELRAEFADLTLETFVTSPRWRPLWENYQARHLVHEIDLACAPSISAYECLDEPLASLVTHHSHPLQSLFDSVPISVPKDELLEHAHARLDQIDIVGTTDDLQSIVCRVGALWDVPSPLLLRHNVNRLRPRSEDVPAELIDEVRAGTAVDASLFERAVTRSRQSTICEQRPAELRAASTRC